MAILHGKRYRRPGNQSLENLILSDLRSFDLDETLEFYNTFVRQRPKPEDFALLACNDRFFLLTALMNRRDMIHPWVFDRCREVEAEPDNCLDLWARFHFKTSIITTGGTIQEICRWPEITIGLFSWSKEIAQKMLGQIKREAEDNDALKRCFPDVFWWNPRTESPKWTDKALIFKRTANPKEATVEAHGLDSQPTSTHFVLRIYDDLVTDKNVTTPEQIEKTNVGWELSDNLGGGYGQWRRWHCGTHYSFADTYMYIREKKILKLRVYAATQNGRENGKPVLFTPKEWDEKRITQRKTLAAQLLLNPAAGNEAMFLMRSMRPWEVRPAIMNVYIMVDPSSGRTGKSDRTAIAVVGIDTLNNRYLLDGYCHRMKMSERWQLLKQLYLKWKDEPGIQLVKVGYERYGSDTDMQYLTERMEIEKIAFAVEELAWPREGGNSKKDRVSRLQPDFDTGRFYLPGVVWHAEFEEALWRVPAEHALKMGDRFLTLPYQQKGESLSFNEAVARYKAGTLKATGEYSTERQARDASRDSMQEVEYRPFIGMTKAMQRARERSAQGIPSNLDEYMPRRMIAAARTDQGFLCAAPLKRRDENNRTYDLTRVLMDEMRTFPFSSHDDLVDALSRLYDMDPRPAVAWERDAGLPAYYRDS